MQSTGIIGVSFGLDDGSYIWYNSDSGNKRDMSLSYIWSPFDPHTMVMVPVDFNTGVLDVANQEVYTDQTYEQ